MPPRATKWNQNASRFSIPKRDAGGVRWHNGAWWCDHRIAALRDINQWGETRLDLPSHIYSAAGLKAARTAARRLLNSFEETLEDVDAGGEVPAEPVPLVEAFNEWGKAHFDDAKDGARGGRQREAKNRLRAAADTVDHAREALDFLVLIGVKDVTAISASNTAKFHRHLKAKYRRENSRRRRWIALRTWLKWVALEQDVVPKRNPFPIGLGPKVRTRANVSVPTPQEVAELLDALRNLTIGHQWGPAEDADARRRGDLRYAPAYVRLALIAYTGCRLGETAYADWSHVRWEAGLIQIVDGKRSTQERPRMRTTPLWPHLADVLHWWRLERARREGTPPAMTGLILPPREDSPAKRLWRQYRADGWSHAQMERILRGEVLTEDPAYKTKLWRTTALAMELEDERDAEDALVPSGTYSPYRALARARRDYGLNDDPLKRITPQKLRAMVTTLLTSVREPGLGGAAFTAASIERVIGHSPQTRDVHYLMTGLEGTLPIQDALDYHAWAGRPYHSPNAGPAFTDTGPLPPPPPPPEEPPEEPPS
jgi:integrase